MPGAGWLTGGFVSRNAIPSQNVPSIRGRSHTGRIVEDTPRLLGLNQGVGRGASQAETELYRKVASSCLRKIARGNVGKDALDALARSVIMVGTIELLIQNPRSRNWGRQNCERG